MHRDPRLHRRQPRRQTVETEYEVYTDAANWLRRSRHRVENGDWSPWQEEGAGIWSGYTFERFDRAQKIQPELKDEP